LCLGIGVWALLSTRSPAKKIDGDFTCEELELPAAAKLNLNDGRTQLRTARLWGFEGTIANVGQSASTSKYRRWPANPASRSRGSLRQDARRLHEASP
jgi:hypothetical protein